MSLCLEESAQGNVTIVAPEKRADATSLAAATGMRTTTVNAAVSETVIAKGTVTETEKERGRENTGTARPKGQGRHIFGFFQYLFIDIVILFTHWIC